MPGPQLQRPADAAQALEAAGSDRRHGQAHAEPQPEDLQQQRQHASLATVKSLSETFKCLGPPEGRHLRGESIAFLSRMHGIKRLAQASGAASSSTVSEDTSRDTRMRGHLNQKELRAKAFELATAWGRSRAPPLLHPHSSLFIAIAIVAIIIVIITSVIVLITV